MSELEKKAREPKQAHKRGSKKGLGRGLDALMGDVLQQPGRAADTGNAPDNGGRQGQLVHAGASGGAGDIGRIAISKITANPDQPRRHFDSASLSELAASIKQHGIVQPIVVRPHDAGYQIVAGERRWRAAQKAQLHEIPAIIRDFGDEEVLEIALIENIQRQDLNPIEEAEAYKRLSDEFGHSQAALAKAVQKSRSHVANMMRLLDLSAPLRDLVIEEKLSMGHARALLGADDAVPLAALVVKKGLSVRQTEALVRKSKKANNTASVSAAGLNVGANDADIAAVESHLSDLLGLKVSISTRRNGKAGAVTFDYNSLDQLDMLCQRLTGESF